MTEHAIVLTSFRLDQEGFRRAILGKLIYQVGKDPQNATRHDWFFALALAVEALATRLAAEDREAARRRAGLRCAA